MEGDKKAVTTQNWADMDHEGEDDQEIGVQGEAKPEAEETKKEESSQQQDGQRPYQRKKKDYGDKYDPNYKKKQWRKGDAPTSTLTEEQRKNLQPPAPRTKTDRGDYVVTSFHIPDRVAAIGKSIPKAEEGEQKKVRKVGAFQLDSDEEVEEDTVQEAVVEEAKKEEIPVPKVTETAKPLSKKEQKKRELEELEALLGPVTAVSTTE